jgi:ankyrin repeat protein
MCEFRKAVERNDIAAASLLIKDVALKTCCTQSPLHLTAVTGRVEIMAMLLDAGADIDALDEKRNTACHIAVRYQQFDALKLLIERGANVGVGNPRNPLLKLAVRGNDERIAILLLDSGATLEGLSHENLIELLVHTSSVGVLARLLARNVNVSALRDRIGRSVCHLVVWTNGDIEPLLRGLVDAGADVNAVDARGDTPLHYAAINCNSTGLRVLVELGAEIDQQQPNGRTALHLAVVGWTKGYLCTKLLLALGADVRLVDNQGQTACHCAAAHSSAALCAVVAARGDMDQPNNDGNTPRQIAIDREFALPTAADIDAARGQIAKARFDAVRQRALQICIGLQSRNLDTLQLCEVMMQSCGTLGSLIAFHQWWAIASTVKHFHDHKKQSNEI